MPAVLSCCSLFLRSRGRRGNEKLQRRRSPRERLCCCPGGAAGLAAPDASRVTQVGARPAAAGVATCPPTPRLPEAAGAGPEGGPAALAACPVGWAPRLLPELHAAHVRPRLRWALRSPWVSAAQALTWGSLRPPEGPRGLRALQSLSPGCLLCALGFLWTRPRGPAGG